MKKMSVILLHLFIAIGVIGIIAEEFVMPKKQRRTSSVKKLQKQEQSNDVTILRKLPDLYHATASAQEYLQEDLLQQIENGKQSKDIRELTHKVQARENIIQKMDQLVLALQELTP